MVREDSNGETATVRSSVNGRWTLTLAKPVDYVVFLTLSNPVECDPALLFMP